MGRQSSNQLSFGSSFTLNDSERLPSRDGAPKEGVGHPPWALMEVSISHPALRLSDWLWELLKETQKTGQNTDRLILVQTSFRNQFKEMNILKSG